MKLTLILVPTAAPQTVTASATGPTIVLCYLETCGLY